MTPETTFGLQACEPPGSIPELVRGGKPKYHAVLDRIYTATEREVKAELQQLTDQELRALFNWGMFDGSAQRKPASLIAAILEQTRGNRERLARDLAREQELWASAIPTPKIAGAPKRPCTQQSLFG